MTSRAAAGSEQWLGVGLMVLAASCFGTLGPLSRFADDAGVEPLSVVTWRAALGAAMMTAFIGVRWARRSGGAEPLRTASRRTLAFLLGGSVASAILNLAMFIAFVRISIALSLLVFYLYPAFVAVTAVLWFGARLDALRWAALGLSLTGMVLVVAGAGALGELDMLGVGLAFVAALGQTFYVLAARHGFGSVPGPQAAAVTMGGSAAIYLVVALVLAQGVIVTQPLVSFEAFGPVLLIGTIGAGIPTLSYIVGIRILGPPRAAILATLEPVVGVLLAAWLLAEQPTVVQLVGGALILSAAVVLQLRPRIAPAAEHEAVDSG